MGQKNPNRSKFWAILAAAAIAVFFVTFPQIALAGGGEGEEGSSLLLMLVGFFLLLLLGWVMDQR